MADGRRLSQSATNLGLFTGAGASVRPVIQRLPELTGLPIRIDWRPSLRSHRGRLHSGPGPGDEVHAATFPRQRLIIFGAELHDDESERARIFTHEVFHFVWLKLGNTRRNSWGLLLRDECNAHARGELGWSAEWRKRRLSEQDIHERTRLWREYACESFCDTAAWRWSGLEDHREYTLARRWRNRRNLWLAGHLSQPFRI